MFWNKYDGNKQAKKLLKSRPLGYEEIRELLILTTDKSCSIADSFFKECIQGSNIEVLDYLVRISGDTDDLGDAPMQACYYIKDYPVNLLEEFHDGIAHAFLNDDTNERRFLAIALGKLKCEKTKEYIYNFSKNEERFDNWIFKEVVKFYEM